MMMLSASSQGCGPTLHAGPAEFPARMTTMYSALVTLEAFDLADSDGVQGNVIDPTVSSSMK